MICKCAKNKKKGEWAPLVTVRAEWKGSPQMKQIERQWPRKSRQTGWQNNGAFGRTPVSCLYLVVRGLRKNDPLFYSSCLWAWAVKRCPWTHAQHDLPNIALPLPLSTWSGEQPLHFLTRRRCGLEWPAVLLSSPLTCGSRLDMEAFHAIWHLLDVK